VLPNTKGEFEFERFGERKRISFNAKNLQFQALYAPFPRHGYEPDVTLLLERLLPEGGTFFDVGSNWGYFPLYAASLRQQLTVHAFEPMPGTFRDLVQCVGQAGLDKNVTCHHLALSDSDGEMFIGRPDRLHSGQATVSASGGESRVGTKRLDGMSLPRPDFIKIDVEGHELAVLRGAAETLRTNRPFLIFENKPFGGEPEKTVQPLFYLNSLGYELFVPAICRKGPTGNYLMTTGGQRPLEGDMLMLVPLKAAERLLWQEDLNVFACHAERLGELARLLKC
jgi:FkbM family methyltransferase